MKLLRNKEKRYMLLIANWMYTSLKTETFLLKSNDASVGTMNTPNGITGSGLHFVSSIIQVFGG